MKVLYSQLQKYLPNLTASPKDVADVFTLTGFMLDKLTEVEYRGQKDFLMDLEVRQNRADSFGVWGLARELSAYYKIPLKYPEYNINLGQLNYKLPITISAKEAVKRVQAIKMIDLEIKESPEWLKDYLDLYDINSVNNLVDLTNYVMLETGHASHVFDTELVGDSLIWEINNGKYSKMTTLNGDEIVLSKDSLVISDGKRPLSLSFIGGKDDAVSMNTKKVVIEMAVYNGTVVRRNSRELKVMTEAGTRLEKYMDPNSVPHAFEWLLSLIKEECGGTIESELFDEYIQHTPEIEINVDLDKVQQVAGIQITYSESKEYLKNLGFTLKEDNNNSVVVLRPLNRLDIESAQDVFEEIIRMKGFNNIPSNYLTTQVVKDITPSRINLMENITNFLSANSMDEVRSWVLVDQETNNLSNSVNWEEVRVTNSINDEVPYLRQSIAVSLLGQTKTYLKNNINPIELFEIGKIFGKQGGNYVEVNSLGMLSDNKDINILKNKVESLVRHLGIDKVEYEVDVQAPKSAHPLSCWKIKLENQNAGILYLTNKAYFSETCIAELNIDLIDSLITDRLSTSTMEVTQRIVTLDTNILKTADVDINSFVIKKLERVNENLWSWSIVDEFKTESNIKYTVRVSYVNLSDTKAKELHASLFE